MPKVLGGGVFMPVEDKLEGMPSKPFRLAQIDAELDRILDLFKPATAALEAGFIYPGRLQGVLTLSEVRGVCIAATMRHGVPIHEYSPSEIKKGATGKGDADKDAVRHAVRVLFGLENVPPEDYADSLAAGWLHLGRQETNAALQRVDAEITRQINRELMRTGPRRKRYAVRKQKGGEVD